MPFAVRIIRAVTCPSFRACWCRNYRRRVMISVTAIANSAVFKAVQCNDKIVEKEDMFRGCTEQGEFRCCSRARKSRALPQRESVMLGGSGKLCLAHP